MRQLNLMTTHGGKDGWCPDCNPPFANLANHVPFCNLRDHEAAQQRETVFISRAAAHANARNAWAHAVTDQDVALVMYAVEAMSVDIQQNSGGHWVGWRVGSGIRLHWVVTEMIRAGLLRDYRRPGRWRSELIPALVHLRGADGWSVCHFTGEGRGPMVGRTVTDPALADCLACGL